MDLEEQKRNDCGVDGDRKAALTPEPLAIGTDQGNQVLITTQESLIGDEHLNLRAISDIQLNINSNINF